MNICFFLLKVSPLCLILPQFEKVRLSGGCCSHAWTGLMQKNKFIFFSLIYKYVPLIEVFSWGRFARDALESAKSVLGGWSSTGDVVVGFCWRPPDEGGGWSVLQALGGILRATSWAWAPQEVSGMIWRQIPDGADEWTNQERWSVGPTTQTQRRTGWKWEGWRQPCLQELRHFRG